MYPLGAAQTRMVSAARIRLNSRKSVGPFKGIICHDISEFESHMASHAVGLHSYHVKSVWMRPRCQQAPCGRRPHRVDHGTICGRSCANSGHYKPLCACVDRFSSGDGPVRLGLVASHRHQFFCNFQPRLSMLTSVLNNAWSGPFPADRGAPSQHNDG